MEISSEVSELEDKYNDQVSAISKEIDNAVQNLFSLQLAFLIERLSDSIEQVKADLTVYDPECYSSASAYLSGKDKLLKVHQSFRQLLVQQYGNIYASCPSPEELINAAMLQVVEWKELPLRL